VNAHRFSRNKGRDKFDPLANQLIFLVVSSSEA